jgi:hypothetical protein
MTIDELDDWLDQALAADPLELELELVDSDDKEVIAIPLRSADELTNARANLTAWQSPMDFQRTVKALHTGCRSGDIFNNPRLKFLLDAWILAELTLRQPVDLVRLTCPNEQWPDGQIRIGTTIENVEVTSAHEPGRRMGAEYKFPGKAELDPVENWEKRAATIPAALEKAIGDKIAKYRSNCGRMWLAVYLNINEYGIRQAECEALIAAIKQKHSPSFGNLFVLWKDKLI